MTTKEFAKSPVELFNNANLDYTNFELDNDRQNKKFSKNCLDKRGYYILLGSLKFKEPI